MKRETDVDTLTVGDFMFIQHNFDKNKWHSPGRYIFSTDEILKMAQDWLLPVKRGKLMQDRGAS